MEFPSINLLKSADINRGHGIDLGTINNQTQLFHEMELLRSENYQLRLRVYNAEQRVDRLLSAVALGWNRKTSNGTDTDSESTDTDSESTDTDSESTDTDSESTDTDSESTDTDSESTDTDSESTDTDSEDADASSGHARSGTGQNNSATKMTAEVAERTIHDLNRRLMALKAAAVSTKLATPLETVIEEDEGVGSEVTSPRGQCRPPRPMQQRTKTEPWARNRKFGKQQQCMAKVVNARSGQVGSGINQNNAKAKAEAVARTIPDLLALNRRLLALLAAKVSAKSVSVSTDKKRRWRELRSNIEEYAVHGPNKEKTNEDEDHDDDKDDNFNDASAIDFETFWKARLLSVDCSVTRQNVLRSSPQPPSSTPLVSKEDESFACDKTRQCRPIRSVNQLMKTELWAQNQKFFGKLEQKWFMAQVAYAGTPRDRSPPEEVLAAAIALPPQRRRLQEFRLKAATSTALPPTSKGIPQVIQSPSKTLGTAKAPEGACTESLQTAAASSPLTLATTTTRTPPLVLSDYSEEVDFFFSCDEEDDDHDDDYRLEDFADINCTSSSELETADWNDCRSDGELPVRLAAIGAPVASSTRTRRRCRRHRQSHQPIKDGSDSSTVTMTTSSSTESAAAEDEANESNGDGVISTKTISTSHRTANVGKGSNKSRRCMVHRRCFRGAAEPPSVADAQVQYDDENVVAVDSVCSSDRGDGELELLQLRCELDAQRRENGRLNDMVLRSQSRTRQGDSGPGVPFPESGPSGSPEPSRRAAGEVDGRIAIQLPALLSVQPISEDGADGGDGDHQRYWPDGVEQLQMQLTHLREPEVMYERRELDDVDDDTAALRQSRPEDPLNDVIRRMDHTNLINVGLPQVVERLRRALVLLHNRAENVAAK